MKVGIIGLGLIGGSMAIDLRKRRFASEIIGVENDVVNSGAAVSLGLVDRMATLEDCVKYCDLTVVAVPVDAAVKMLPHLLDMVAGTDKVVIDVCSIKEPLSKAVNCHKGRGRYVATHPMAGTEYSGPWAAVGGLFDSRACIVADSAESDPDAVRLAERLYGTLNMRLIYMGSEAHDVHAAYVSHISHVTSFALALTVLDKEKDEKHIFDMASGGFSSTVRLAKSNADTWVPILLRNKDNVLRVMDTYMEKMSELRDAISSDDAQKVQSMIEEANSIKRIIR